MWAQQKYNFATASFQVRLFIELFGRVCNHHIGGCMAKRAQVAEIDSKYLPHMHTITMACQQICSWSFSWPAAARLFLILWYVSVQREKWGTKNDERNLLLWLVNSTPLGNGGGCLKIEMWWYMMLPSVHPRKCAQKGNPANLWLKPLQKHHI